MRKISNMFMLVAAAAMTFVSCQKEENRAPETVSATLTMHAGVDQTKTYLDENNTVLWGKGEAVSLYVGTGEGEDAIATFVASTPTDAYDGAETASFTFDITGVAENGPYNLGGIYPASAAMEDNKDPKKCRTILPQIQNAEVGKYDPSAYIMVLKPETVETLPNEYLASFRRATALNKITLTNVKEDITTVEITVPEGQALAGRRYFDLTDGTSGEIYYGQSNTITVNAPFTGSIIDVWFCSWGAELAAGEEMTIRMKNANKSFTRTIVVKEAGIKFVEGDLNKLTVDMASAEEESFDSFAGEWLITGTTGGVTYAAGAYVTGKSNLNNNVAITISNDVIEPVDGVENCKMLFTKVTEGEYEGMYTIQDANGKYLYAASSSGNHLKAGDSANSAHYYWTVESKDGKHSIVASKSSNRNVMQFNPNNNSPLFSCYASATQTALVLYPFSMVMVDTTPKIVVSETTKDVAFGGETVTFGYELKYLDDEELTWEVSDSEIITEVTAEDGVLSVTVAENAGEARTATITLSCGDAEDVVLTIEQTEYGGTSEMEITSVADFLSAEVADGVYYTLKGTITRVVNTTYGNFDLTDDTGTVYIYGLCSEDGTTNKYWTTSGAKLGDDIVIRTIRADFNGPQGKNAWFVSLTSPGTRAFYTLDTEAVDFTSEGGSKDVTVTAYNTTAAVTASSDNAKFTVSVNGYKVTVSSTANDLEEVVSGNITIKVGDLVAKIVKVTLAAKPASGVVEGGQDDFHTISSTNTSYVTGKTTAGWNYKNCAIFKGGTSDSSPAFKMIGDASNRALCMNGKTSAVGSITSPTLTTGCGTLKFNYGLPFSDTKIKFSVDIKQGNAVVKTFTVDNSSATKYTKYSHEVEINVAGDFQIVFTNLSPSNNAGNKDRTAVWDVEWTGYQN